MATLATLRALTRTFLGVSSADPFYTDATVDALVNDAYLRFAADLIESSPSMGRAVATLTAASATSHEYALPVNYARYIDVRLEDADGGRLSEASDEDILNLTHVAAFAVSGPPTSATLTTSGGVAAGTDLYLKYAPWPAELAASGDQPSFLPTAFHSLIAREAAVQAFGVGDEQQAPPQLMESRADQLAQFWAYIGRRGVQSSFTRET